MSQADVVIYLFDVNEISAEELQIIIHELKEKSIHYLLVGNKIDLSADEELAEKFSNINVLYISAGNRKNVEVLKQR